MKAAKDLVAGVVGLGIIGGGVASSLANSGRKTVVYNRTPGKYAKYKGCPPEEPSLKDVAEKADIIMIAVFDYAQCETVLLSEDGLLANAHEGTVIVLQRRSGEVSR